MPIYSFLIFPTAISGAGQRIGSWCISSTSQALINETMIITIFIIIVRIIIIFRGKFCKNQMAHALLAAFIKKKNAVLMMPFRFAPPPLNFAVATSAIEIYIWQQKSSAINLFFWTYHQGKTFPSPLINRHNLNYCRNKQLCYTYQQNSVYCYLKLLCYP